MKYFVFLAFIINTSFAQFDFKYGASARSFPHTTGELSTELGHNYIIWGSKENSPLFGMIRSSVEGHTSFVVSHYDAKLTLYPISIIGFGIGRQELNSNYDEFEDFDCDNLRCKGRLTKNYSFAKMAFGAGNIIATFTYSLFLNQYNDPTNSNKDVAEYQYLVSVNPGQEKEIHRTYFGGYKMGHSIFGIVSNEVQFLKTSKEYKLNAVIYQTTSLLENFKTSFGIGSLQTSDQKPGTAILFKISREVLPGIALF